MADEAKVKMSGESQQLLATLASVQKGFDAITAAMTKQEEKSKKANKEVKSDIDSLNSALSNQLSQLKGIALGWASVSGAAALAGAEVEKYKNRMANAAGATNTFASAVAAATRNAPAGFSGSQIQAMSEQAASSAGLSPSAVAGALPATFAAGGAGLNAQQYSDILKAAGPVAFGSVPEYQSTASVAASFMAQNPNLTAEQSIGFIQTAAGGSLVNKFDQYGPLAVSVAASANAQGIDMPQSLAMLNATTRGTGDVMGPSSRTAVIQYMDALNQARTDLKLPKNATPQQIIAALRDPKNAAYARKFEGGLKAEASHKAFMQSVTQEGGIGAKFFDQGFAATPTIASAQTAYGDMRSNVMSAPAVQNAMIGQALGGATEQNYINQGEAGIVRTELEKWMQSNPSLALSDKIDMAAFDAQVASGTDATDLVRGQMKARARQLRTPFRTTDLEGIANETAPTAEALRRAEAMDKLIITLDRIDSTLKQVNAPQPAANGDRPANPANPKPAAGVR